MCVREREGDGVGERDNFKLPLIVQCTANDWLLLLKEREREKEGGGGGA